MSVEQPAGIGPDISLDPGISPEELREELTRYYPIACLGEAAAIHLGVCSRVLGRVESLIEEVDSGQKTAEKAITDARNHAKQVRAGCRLPAFDSIHGILRCGIEQQPY